MRGVGLWCPRGRTLVSKRSDSGVRHNPYRPKYTPTGFNRKTAVGVRQRAVREEKVKF
jgi:hypothetical protein